MALKVGVEVRYHKTDEFPQITLQHVQNMKSHTTEGLTEQKLRLTYVCDDKTSIIYHTNR